MTKKTTMTIEMTTDQKRVLAAFARMEGYETIEEYAQERLVGKISLIVTARLLLKFPRDTRADILKRLARLASNNLDYMRDLTNLENFSAAPSPITPSEIHRTDIQRGEVWQVDFVSNICPAVVVSEDQLSMLPLRLVVPLTEWHSNYSGYIWSTHIPSTPENGLTKDSAANAIQLKSIPEAHFIEKSGVLAEEQMEEITAAIAVCIGLEIWSQIQLSGSK